LRWTEVGKFKIVLVEGELSFENSKSVKREIIELCTKNSGDLILDLSDVSYIDSLGFATLLSVLHACIACKKKVFYVIPEGSRVREAMNTTGLGNILTIRESVKEILESEGG